MCKKTNYKSSNTRIDKCMRNFITNLNSSLKPNIRAIACCCGHGKYPMTVVVKRDGIIYDLVSGEPIPRKRKFYKRDKQGFYYIPEVIENK